MVWFSGKRIDCCCCYISRKENASLATPPQFPITSRQRVSHHVEGTVAPKRVYLVVMNSSSPFPTPIRNTFIFGGVPPCVACVWLLPGPGRLRALGGPALATCCCPDARRSPC